MSRSARRLWPSRGSTPRVTTGGATSSAIAVPASALALVVASRTSEALSTIAKYELPDISPVTLAPPALS